MAKHCDNRVFHLYEHLINSKNPFLHDKYTFLLQEAKHSERTGLHHKGPKHHHHKLIPFQDSNCYCGRRWNHKMKKSFFKEGLEMHKISRFSVSDNGMISYVIQYKRNVKDVY